MTKRVPTSEKNPFSEMTGEVPFEMPEALAKIFDFENGGGYLFFFD